jgi:hypothetical protein
MTMERRGSKPRPGSAVRRDAEIRFSAAAAPDAGVDAVRLWHELQVHQIELAPLGLTKGRGKDDHTNRQNRSLKLLFGYPLVRDFRRRLCTVDGPAAHAPQKTS